MSDPLSQMIQLLRPRAVFSKGITGAGRWAVRYEEFGKPGFCAAIEGQCRLSVDGEKPVILEEGDFVLLPTTPGFVLSGLEPGPMRRIDPHLAPTPDREVRHGRQDGPADFRQFGGWFTFDSPDADLLVSLLPRMIHIKGIPRLSQLVRLVGEEAGENDVGRDLILARLVEILLIESLRRAPAEGAESGLLRGLGDPRIAAALHGVHGDIQRPWTIVDLAREAGMSRSAFFDRFVRTVGIRPMEYLANWRMAVAKDLLRGGNLTIDEIADRVGYASASTFSTAFSRHVGVSPGRFLKWSASDSDAMTQHGRVNTVASYI